ncbi:hypothetical protein V5O48_000492 [Marasmius crinis-equi]|uniref:Uncharacterized protein n=1 Tax=Marasmius crinis-equi TaxID=585013 RepID=A0ABR3G186_9AGAR
MNRKLSDTRTLLLSRKNGLVTACNVLLDELAHQDGRPYVLTSGSRDTFAGHTFLPRNGDDGSFFRVMEDGGLVRYDLNWGDGDEIQSQGLNWSDDVLALRDSSTSRKPNHGPLGGREFSQVNLRPVYEHLFSDLEAEVEDLDEVLDSLSTYWQRTEAPVDYVLTTHDIIRSCGDEPERPSRSNFLAPNSLISTDGYRALLGGRFPWETLRQNSQWHRGIGDTLSNVPTHRNDDIQSLNDSLTSPDVFEDEDTDARIRRRQEKAREGLSLDLILSKDIYCHRPVPSLTPALETMAGALSLSEEPPSVAFSFLQPMHSGDHYSKEEEKDEQVEMPLGVRLLLKEWEIGTDPNDAVFTDPYGEQEPPNILRKKSAFSPPPIEPVPFEVQPQAPPMVLASSTLAPTPVTKTLPQTFSQPIDNLPVPSEGETQGMFASTQVLPGPFGARPKKKPGKKRLGGF